VTVSRLIPLQARRLTNGSVLFGIVVMLVLIGAASYWAAVGGHSDLLASSKAAEVDVARELRNAALAHATSVAAEGNCTADTTVTNAALGKHAYSFTLSAAAPATTQVFSPVHDSYIGEKKSDASNGAHPDLHSKLKDGDDAHGLMRFDTSSLTPGATVQSATLHLYIHEEDPFWPVAIHENTERFDEVDVTWDSYSDAYHPNQIAAIPPSADKDHRIRVPITALVQRWVNNPISNNGLRFVATQEDRESKISAKEYADAANRPYLEVSLANSANKQAQAVVSGTLSDGRSLNARTHTLPLTQSPQTLSLRPGSDSEDAWYDDDNHDTDVLIVSATQEYSALRFEIAQIPRGATITNALLELHPQSVSQEGSIRAQLFTAIWDESIINKDFARFLDGWARDWGEVDNALFHEASTDGTQNPVTIDVKEGVQRWVNGAANYGFRLATSDADVSFASSDHANQALRPGLVVEYTCPCGQSCEPGSGNNRELLFIVDSVLAMSAQNRLRYQTFTAWGYIVTPVADGIFAFNPSGSLSGKDVVFVSNSTNASNLAGLANATVGIVSENPFLADELGLAQNVQNRSSSTLTIDVINESVTAAFPLGDIEVSQHSIATITYDNPASGALGLASIGGRPTLLTLANGALDASGNAATSNRLGLPFGANVDWSQLSSDALLLIRESLQWADSGSSVVAFCNANFAPNAVERSIATGGFSLQDVTWVPQGAELNGTLAPADGAWVVVDAAAQTFRMLDGDGNLLTTLAAPTSFPKAIAYIESGTNKSNWAYVGLSTDQLVIMDTAGAAVDKYDTTLDGLLTPSGIAYIGVTPAGTYDDQLAVVDEFSSRIGFYDQDGNVQQIVTLSETEAPQGIEHLPGSDKLLITYPSSRTIIDFAGNLIRSYNAGQPALAQGTSIHGETCQHVLADETTLSLKFLETARAPIAQWRFDEATGTSSFDDISSREARLDAVTWALTGVSGSAVSFNGATSEARVAEDPLFARDRELSITGWIYPQSLTGRQGILSNDPFYELSLEGDELVFTSTGSGAQTIQTTGAAIGLNEWTNIGATVDAAGEVELYVNGARIGGDTLAASSPLSSNDLLIGADQSGNRFRGVIDEISIYHNSLSLSELVADYDSSAPPGNASPFCVAARDDFETQDWSGSTGNLNWLSNWLEVNETTDPGSGDIRVETPFSSVARLRDNDGGGEGIERAINLAGNTSATLRFDYWRGSLESNDFVIVEFSRDDGASWNELQRIFGPGSDSLTGSGIESTLTLPPPLTNESKIRFLTWSGMGPNDRVYLDNVSITACP